MYGRYGSDLRSSRTCVRIRLNVRRTVEAISVDTADRSKECDHLSDDALSDADARAAVALNWGTAGAFVRSGPELERNCHSEQSLLQLDHEVRKRR